jgi:RimJ/RimL family protein N-acetyltransferase
VDPIVKTRPPLGSRGASPGALLQRSRLDHRTSLPTLLTTRLILRARSLGDTNSLLHLHQDLLVMRFSLSGPLSAGAGHGRSLESKLFRANPPGLGHWSVFLKSDPTQFVGSVMLVPSGEQSGEVEAGWRLMATYWGQGIGSEAVAAVLSHGFTTQIGKICALIHRCNRRSMRLAGRLGFRPFSTSNNGTHAKYCVFRSDFSISPLNALNAQPLSATQMQLNCDDG